MKFLNLGSINKNLALLVILVVLPALGILFYTGLEQRRHSIERAKREVLLLTRTMADAQKEITSSTKQILATLSLLPEVQAMNSPACGEIFKAVLEKNLNYNNITLTDLNGEVLAAGKTFSGTNLADRKHFREALARKDFAVGEYIISRTGSPVPAFAFAYPVLDNTGNPKAVLTASIRLASFSRFHDVSNLPDKSFVAVTDHQGLRLFYYPPREKTNPVGKPIPVKIWEAASKAKEQGTFIGAGADGVRRIFAFEPVALAPGSSPYLYVWAGVPEAYILAPVSAVVSRNLLLMSLAAGMSLFIAWIIGRNTLIAPLQSLVSLTGKFARGDLEARSELPARSGEFGALSKAFHEMADALAISQKAQRENEARFRLLMDSLDAVVYVADMETYEILFVNRYAKKMLGDISGKICWQNIQQGQSGPCSFCTNKYLLDGEGKPGEVYIWEFQNSVTGQWVYIHDRAIEWIDGRLVRLEVATDISKIKQAEARLAEERERLAVTLESIGDGVITTDTHGLVVLINRVAETLTGWSSQEAVGRPLAEVFTVVSGETRQPCEDPVGKVLTSGTVTGLGNDTVLIGKDGQERNIAESGAPIRDEDGKIIGTVLVIRDITRQLRTEQELVKVKKLESIGVLAGGLAHDFNNIITAILGNIDLSLQDSNLAPETHKLLSETEKASLRARDLTRQLLTFSKGGEPIIETASLVDVVKDSADFVLRGSRVACRYLFSDDLWLVDIDTSQISQVVQNIILNASSAMPGGGIVEVTCENMNPANSTGIALPKGGDYVKMTIKDSGVGIPPNVLDKIFDPYFSTKRQGSGLGLAITHSIVSRHGGHIAVHSTPGLGTTFTVYIPASAQRSIPVKKAETADLSTRRCTIMVMDDDEQIRNLTQAMLGYMGHKVVLAKDGGEAVRLYKEAMNSNAAIDLVIMDLTIPGGMGGKEAVREILARDPEAKVIVSSGYSNDPVMANFKEYGFCAAIVKPYKLHEVAREISQFTDRT